ncbi:TIGR04255 family protein [Arthrobacter gyeryongensis]|uniref:TIGR04255 family protein n=1 Tax=Arthrobacter gyeryongensis TaxID=1650592 RepID=A0ABP8VCY9_9MICC
MNQREIYPNAPLVSVSFELRHPESDTLSAKQRSLFKELIRQYLPVMRTQQSTVQTVEIGPSGPVQHVSTEEVPKYFDRENTMAASLLKSSTIVETTQYPGWERFREVLAAVCSARHEVSNIDGVERIGLRYIDEIRVPGTDIPDWGMYLNDSLLGPRSANGIGLPLKQWQGVAAFGPEKGRSLVLRYASGEGFATDPNGELRRKSPSYPGPFFLLDVDSFWVPEAGVPEFSPTLLTSQGDALHAPVREMFEQLITDRLRNEVFRK